MSETVRFQHFEVLRREDDSLFELGRGAMGVTYKAFDTNLRCHVALKVISPAYLDSDIARERFLREARAAAALRHPNVATVFHLGQADDSWFYAMEFIDGETVEQWMRREGAIPAKTSLEIADQVARALGAAQKQGLIHRDIKPSNLMIVREDGDEFTVKVIDFGLAKAVDRDSDVDAATLTTGGFLGTPHFASPEQLEERDLDVRSDIYSLGVTLYYMLAGHTPFSGSLAQVMSQHLHRDPPLDRLPDVPETVVALLRAMLEKDAGSRPQSPSELRERIDMCRQGLPDLADASRSRAMGTLDSHDTLMETAVADSPETPATQPAPGMTLAGRFQLIEEYPAGQYGRTFRALNRETGEHVAILLLDASVLPTSNAYTRLENEITALQTVRHASVIRVDSVEHTEHVTFISREWSDGPSLLDTLRTNPPNLDQALRWLESLAGGLDAVQGADVPCPELIPGWITMADGSGDGLVPKFNPINLAHVAPPVPGVTLAGDRPDTGARAPRGGSAFNAALARIAVVVFGGRLGGTSGGGFVPIAGLSEAANEALRGVITGAETYPSAGEFFQKLAGALGSSRLLAERPSGHREAPAPKPPESTPRPRRRTGLLVVLGVLLVMLLAGSVIVWTVVVPRLARLVDVGSATRDIAQVPVGADDAVSDPIPDSTPVPVPVPPPTPTPTPEPTPDPTPEPTPDPVEVAITEALERANLLAAEQNYATAFSVLDDLSKIYPEDARVPQAIENTAAKLRAESPELEGEKFEELREPLTEMAQAGSPSAQMLLARSLDAADDKSEAFKFYLLAAENGNSEAMLIVGDRFASGTGTDENLRSAFEWFDRAARKGERRALYAVGECYRDGRGVGKDINQAIHYFTQAAAYNDPVAMGELGVLYREGVGLTRPNYREAARLLTAAAEAGNVRAQANLGVMIITGEIIDGNPVDGRPDPASADRRKAFQLFKDGAERGDALSTYFYAMCLEQGAGTAPNASAARENYIAAARLGDPQAQARCKKENWKY